MVTITNQVDSCKFSAKNKPKIANKRTTTNNSKQQQQQQQQQQWSWSSARLAELFKIRPFHSRFILM
ncbi:MAG: hypothetical protein N6V41_01525, partial [Candidatus Portiera aleyrodidarum]|nr:hypothetical protein [Candidatus Portiera aleyrodidarum]